MLLVDDNLFNHRQKAEELFRALVPLKVRWGCQVTIDVASDESLLDLMAQSGCLAALIGFESLEMENIRQMNKAWTLRHGSYQAAIRKFHDRGIMIYGSFIFGYDNDTPDSIARTLEFAVESKLFLANFSPLTPTPGTTLYDRLRADGRLLYDRWWLDPRYRYGASTYQPRHMTPNQLAESCIRAREVFYGCPSIARRVADVKANARSLQHLGLCLAGNIVSRRELASKLGRSLGGAEPLIPAEPWCATADGWPRARARHQVEDKHPRVREHSCETTPAIEHETTKPTCIAR